MDSSSLLERESYFAELTSLITALQGNSIECPCTAEEVLTLEQNVLVLTASFYSLDTLWSLIVVVVAICLSRFTIGYICNVVHRRLAVKNVLKHYQQPQWDGARGISRNRCCACGSAIIATLMFLSIPCIAMYTSSLLTANAVEDHPEWNVLRLTVQYVITPFLGAPLTKVATQTVMMHFIAVPVLTGGVWFLNMACNLVDSKDYNELVRENETKAVRLLVKSTAGVCLASRCFS